MTTRRTIQTAGSERLDGVLPCREDDHVWRVVGEWDDPAPDQRCRCGAHPHRDTATPKDEPSDSPLMLRFDSAEKPYKELYSLNADGSIRSVDGPAIAAYVGSLKARLEIAESALLAARRENEVLASNFLEAHAMLREGQGLFTPCICKTCLASRAALAATQEPR